MNDNSDYAINNMIDDLLVLLKNNNINLNSTKYIKYINSYNFNDRNVSNFLDYVINGSNLADIEHDEFEKIKLKIKIILINHFKNIVNDAARNKTYPTGKLNISRKWTKILIDCLNYDAIVDNGYGILHENEPYQAVVLKRSAMDIILSDKNPFIHSNNNSYLTKNTVTDSNKNLINDEIKEKLINADIADIFDYIGDKEIRFIEKNINETSAENIINILSDSNLYYYRKYNELSKFKKLYSKAITYKYKNNNLYEMYKFLSRKAIYIIEHMSNLKPISYVIFTINELLLEFENHFKNINISINLSKIIQELQELKKYLNNYLDVRDEFEFEAIIDSMINVVYKFSKTKYKKSNISNFNLLKLASLYRDKINIQNIKNLCNNGYFLRFQNGEYFETNIAKYRFDNPSGIYAYPLTEYILYDAIRNSLPFMGNAKNILVFSINGNILNFDNYNELKLEKDLEKLKSYFKDISDYIDYLNNLSKNNSYNPSLPGSRLFFILYNLSSVNYQTLFNNKFNRSS